MSRKRSRVEVDYRFVPAPHDLVADPRVSAPAVRLWCWLHILDWRHESPDPKRLQALMNTGERSIYRWLKELEAAGWLTWQRNTYDLKHRFLLRTIGPGGDTATVAQIRAALDGAASIEEIRSIVESADRMRETAIEASETFVTGGKSVTDDKTDPVGKSVTRIKSSDRRIRKIVTGDKSLSILARPDASNRPPSEDQKIQNHDDDDGGALVRELVRREMSETAATEIATKGIDPPTLLTFIDDMLAAGKEMGHIVTRLRLAPPRPGDRYEQAQRSTRPDAPNRPGRSAPPAAANPDRDAEYAAQLDQWEQQARTRDAG